VKQTELLSGPRQGLLGSETSSTSHRLCAVVLLIRPIFELLYTRRPLCDWYWKRSVSGRVQDSVARWDGGEWNGT